MTFYFAWVGGDPIPAFTLSTKGDVWGGSVTVLGEVWGGELSTTGDLIYNTQHWGDKARKLVNLRVVDGLVDGRQYRIRGTGISASTDGISNDTYITYDASIYGGNVSLSGGLAGNNFNYPNSAENTSVTLFSTEGTNQIVLADTSKLKVGQLYKIAGAGIPDNTTFTFEGDATIVISNNATKTGHNVELTISTDDGRLTIDHLGTTAGMVLGTPYQIFGRGISPTTLATLQSDGTLTLTEAPSLTSIQTPLKIHLGVQYPDGGDFNSSVHCVFDEQILSLSIDHEEGHFATATVVVKNPHSGFLASGRNVWCWLSWRETDASDPVPLFHGRLFAIPEDIENEKCTLKFLARPSDYEYQQSLVMADLRVAPYWDPVWFANGVDDPTTILEARSAAWHIDRITLAVTISDINIGEDGTINVGSDQSINSGNRHLYESLSIRFGNPPLSAVYVTGSVSWQQQASGTIDITNDIVQAFRDAGTPDTYKSPNIAIYSGDGLFSSWPKPQTSIGAGWTVGLDTAITDVTKRFNPKNLKSTFNTKYPPVGIGSGVYASYSWDTWSTIFPLTIYSINFSVDYNAKRDWTENVSFFLEADIQQIETDSRASVESFSLQSSLITEAIDPGGLMPMRDLRDNSYFKSSRGQDSFKFLLAYARAKLCWRARAVDIEFTIPWKLGTSLTCRQNIRIADPRLPGAVGTGKIIKYRLLMSADEGMKAIVTIGCTVGTGGTVAAVTGTNSFVDGVLEDDVQTTSGGTVDLGNNTVTYENFDDFEVEDDGINFYTLSSKTIVKRVSVTGGYTDQRRNILLTYDGITGKGVKEVLPGAGVSKAQPDPVGALDNCYPLVTLELYPVDGGSFLSEFAVDVSTLQIPKTIDLTAPNV